MKPKSNPFVRSLRSPLPAFTIALSAATLSLDSVQAATWNGGTSTDWNTAANWTGGVPSGADAVVTTISPNIATITGTVPNVAQLLVGTGGSTGRVNHTAGTLNVGSWLVLGSGGGNSTYNLTSTTATGGNLTGFGIGDGSLAKTGGGDFYVAENAGTTATLNINTTGGVSSTSFTSIGHGGNGTVNLDAGSFNTNGWLALGANGGTGTLNMSGGTVNQGTVDTGSRLELTNPGSAGNATVNLNGGTLAVNGIVASGSGAGNVLINLNGGTLKANMDNSGFIANDAEIDRINVRNGGVIIDTNGKNIGIGEALLHSDIGGDSATDGGVTKNGAGTLTLTGINTYTGGTIVNNGTLVLGAGGGSGTIRGTLMINAGATTTLNATDALGYNGGTSVTQINVNGGTLNNAVAGNNGYLASLTLTGGSMTSTGGGAFNIRASSGEARSITTNASGTESLISGNVILRDAGTNSLAVTVADGAAANDLLISGIISQTEGTNGITKGGAGTLTLSNANSYQGATVISAGTLQVGNGGTTGSLHASSAITNNAALIYNRTDSFSVSNAMSGTGTLTKQGAGTLTLTGANTHSGATNVSAGTLAISTTASSIGSLTVADGAGLSVKTAAAGTTPLITTSLTLGTSGATSLAFDFAAINPTVTQISTGALSLNGTITLSLAGTSGLVTNNYTLIDYTGTALSNLNNFAATAYTFGHSSGTLTNNAGNTSVDLNVIADSLVWSGAGAQTWTTATTGDGTGPNDWATKNGLAATNFWANDAVEFNDTYNVGAGSVAVTNRTVTITGADVNPSGVTFNNSSGDYTVTGSFGIAGTGVLIKNGSSKVSLNTANSYTGGTTINGGTLAINSATSLGNASGVLTLNNGTLQITANIPTATRNIALGDANSTILVDSGTTYETTGVISGSGALNKTGAGTLTLGTATNTFSGGLFINAGTVSVDSNVRLGGASGTAGAITLNGGTLRYTNTAAVNNTHPITVNAGGSSLDIFGTATAGQNSRVISGAGTLLGSGALTINGDGAIDAAGGSGALVITGANTYNGAITLQNGAILAIEGGGGSALDSAATVTLKNNSEFSIATGLTTNNAITADGGTNTFLSFTGGGSGVFGGTVTLNSNLTAAMRNWYNTTAQNGSISGQVTGIGALTVNSGGTLTLSNATNNYSGGTTITASKVLVGSSSALGTNAVTVGGSGAQLQLASGVNVGNSLTINGGGVTSQGALWALADSTFSGAINITADSSAGGHFGSAAGTLNLTGPITSSVTVKSRIGTVQFSGTGSNFNALQVQQGTAKLGATDGISTSATVDLGASGAAILDLAGFNQTLVGLTKNTNAATVTNSGSTHSVLTTTGTSAFAGVIQNGATNKTSVTVNGGSLTLSGVNTYTGNTTLSAGTLLAGNASAFGSGGSVNLNGGTFGTTAAVTIANAINVTGTNTIGHAAQGGNSITLSGALTGTGTLTNFVGTGGGGSNVFFTGNLSGFTGTIDYTDDGGSNAQWWRVGSNGSTNDLSNASVILHAGNVSNTVASKNFGFTDGISGATLKVGALSGDGAFQASYNNAGPNTLEIGALNTDTTFSGVIAGGAAGTKISVTKVGSGALTLSGVNLYTEATTVSAGKLIVNGSLASSTTTVAGNATLGGTGSLAGNTTIQNGGTHGAGNSIGKQSFDSLTYSDGSIFEWELGASTLDSDTAGVRGTDWDAVNVSGTLAGLDGGDLNSTSDAIFRVVLNGSQTFADTFWNSDHQWTDIFKTGDAGSDIDFSTIFGGGFAYYNAGSGDIGNGNTSGRFFTINGSTLTWSAVPEPSSALAGLLIAGGLLRRRRN